VVGRANADLVLNGFEKIEGEKEVILRKGKKNLEYEQTLLRLEKMIK
jgi:hypothetical protein